MTKNSCFDTRRRIVTVLIFNNTSHAMSLVARLSPTNTIATPVVEHLQWFPSPPHCTSQDDVLRLVTDKSLHFGCCIGGLSTCQISRLTKHSCTPCEEEGGGSLLTANPQMRSPMPFRFTSFGLNSAVPNWTTTTLHLHDSSSTSKKMNKQKRTKRRETQMRTHLKHTESARRRDPVAEFGNRASRADLLLNSTRILSQGLKVCGHTIQPANLRSGLWSMIVSVR